MKPTVGVEVLPRKPTGAVVLAPSIARDISLKQGITQIPVIAALGNPTKSKDGIAIHSRHLNVGENFRSCTHSSLVLRLGVFHSGVEDRVDTVANRERFKIGDRLGGSHDRDFRVVHHRVADVHASKVFLDDDLISRAATTLESHQRRGLGSGITLEKWWLDSETPADSDEQQSLACLWNSEIGCVDNLGNNAILAFECQVSDDLLPDSHLVHAGDVLHDERHGKCLAKDADEFSVERVSRIFDQTGVIPNLRERLTRRTTNKHVNVPSDFEDPCLYRGDPDVAGDGNSFREIAGVGRDSVRVVVRPGEDRKPCLPEPFRKPTRTCEEVYDGQRCAPATHSGRP